MKQETIGLIFCLLSIALFPVGWLLIRFSPSPPRHYQNTYIVDPNAKRGDGRFKTVQATIDATMRKEK